MGRQILRIAVVLGLACSSNGEVSPWSLPERQCRAVFSGPAEAGQTVLLRIPLSRDQRVGLPLLARDAGGRETACRVVHTSADEISVLVNVKSEDRGKAYSVYYGTPIGNRAQDSTPSARDPEPVVVDLWRVEGHAVPPSWEKMRYMIAQAGAPGQRFFGPSVQSIDRQRLHEPRIVAVRSYVLCRDEGVYRFAVNCDDAGFVLIDGDLAAEWPGEHDGGQWREGPPLVLKAGPHLLEFINRSVRGRSDFHIGWRVPGKDVVASIPAESLLTASLALDVRVECINRTLHPAFVFTRRPPYAFRGSPAVFTPVEFLSTTENWMPSTVRCHWDFGDGSLAEGSPVTHVYAKPGLYSVTLKVRDTLGFAQESTRSVDCRAGDPDVYAIQCESASLPAVCYEIDRIEPSLRVAVDAPPDKKLEVICDVQLRSGPERSLRFEMDGASGKKTFPLAACPAGALRRITWQVRHRGAAIASGRAEFLAPPFARIPAAVAGDRLLDRDGVQLVLIPGYYAGTESKPPPSARLPSKVVCVDDSLTAAGLLREDATVRFDRVVDQLLQDHAHLDVRYAQLPDWAQAPQSYGPLLKFTQVPAAIRADGDIVILSIGLRDILYSVDPEAFERQIAALTDLLCFNMNRRVIWATCPPYPPDPDRIRPYAAAIRKVAEARRIPVADLFTAFLCTEEKERPLFRADRLAPTTRGQLLAGKIIANTLLLELGDIQQCRSTRWNSVFGSLR